MSLPAPSAKSRSIVDTSGISSDPSPARCALCAGPLQRRYQLGARALLYCRACALGQLGPLPTEEELAALYASPEYFAGADTVGYADYARDAPQFARTFRAKLEQLLRHGAVDDLLEIGCGPGYFLREARAAGVRNVLGVDRNRWAVEEARRSGLPVRLGSIEEAGPDVRFDAVVMLDVLEHVREPAAFLAAVHRHLRPDGRLLVMTPNIRSWLARLSGRRWVSLKVPEHVFYYSPRSIGLLLAGAGFRIVSLRGTGQYVTVGFALSRLERLAPRLVAPVRRAARALGIEGRVVWVTNGSIDVVATATGTER